VRCVRLNRIGEQCPDQALEGKKYCSYHSIILEDHDPDGAIDGVSRYPMIYRLAAVVLLLIFLYAAFQALL
jgi:hypothetical protein